MPQTFTQLHYHLVFSTKHREPTLIPTIRDRVWDYLGGIVRGEGGRSHLVGGTADHVHLLATLPQTQALADVVRKLKAGSSAWLHETFPGCGVWWQTGYGAFTVSHSAIERVREYIATQEEHHRERTFQDEFRELLRRHGLEPDEEHMWELGPGVSPLATGTRRSAAKAPLVGWKHRGHHGHRPGGPLARSQG